MQANDEPLPLVQVCQMYSRRRVMKMQLKPAIVAGDGNAELEHNCSDNDVHRILRPVELTQAPLIRSALGLLQQLSVA